MNWKLIGNFILILTLKTPFVKRDIQAVIQDKLQMTATCLWQLYEHEVWCNKKFYYMINQMYDKIGIQEHLKLKCFSSCILVNCRL